MKIQHIILSGVSVLLFSVISGCSNYLDVVPDNDIETIETTFEKREGAYSWFKTCYSMITMDISDIMTCPAYWGTDEVVADDYIRLNNPTVMPGDCRRPANGSVSLWRCVEKHQILRRYTLLQPVS